MVRTGGEVGDTFPKDGGGRELCVPIVVRTSPIGGAVPGVRTHPQDCDLCRHVQGIDGEYVGSAGSAIDQILPYSAEADLRYRKTHYQVGFIDDFMHPQISGYAAEYVRLLSTKPRKHC